MILKIMKVNGNVLYFSANDHKALKWHFPLSLFTLTTISFLAHVAFGTLARNYCELQRTDFSEVVTDYGMDKHILRTVNPSTAIECYEHCIADDCSCVAYQLYQNTQCELLHEDRERAPQDFKIRPHYKYYPLEKLYQCPSKSCTDKSVCLNKCCASNPCNNGGTCIELCKDPRIKFKCICPQGYGGKFCNVKLQACKHYLLLDPKSINGEYSLLDEHDNVYRTFCDFRPEKGMAWTLIESYAYVNNPIYKAKAFYIDSPINQNYFNWLSFRLSRGIMTELAKFSTHFRVTCNTSPYKSTNYTDYVVGKLSEMNFFTMKGEKCFTAEYLSVAGTNCSNCGFLLFQASWATQHPHIDCYHSTLKCNAPVLIEGCTSKGQDIFGIYFYLLSGHGCSSSEYAINKWWFGA